MRKFLNEYFYIPKHGKIREKVMLTRIVLTVAVMAVCLVAISVSAYAYFSCNVTSGSNVIKAANFEANVSITRKDSNNDSVAVTKDGKVQTANLEAGKYTIELTRGNSTAHKGFCVITIGDKKYYIDQIGVDAEKNLTDANVKFDLWLSAPTKIEVLSHWGTSVYYGYKDTARTEIFIVNGSTLDLTTTTTTPVETTPPEATGTGSTEPAETESTEATETQPTTEDTDTTGAITTEAIS